MLQRLIIKNYAIIPELDLDLKPGLSAITGETGAGKSILLNALGLALGRRADQRVLPDDASKCIVEAHFDLPDDTLAPVFEREGLDFNDLLICRREISAGGKSRAFINDTPVQLKVLQEITDHLIELHQQHDNLALQSRDYQVNVLDTLSNAGKLFKDYRATYQELTELKHALQKAKDLEATSSRRKDFLQFQITEFDAAHLTGSEIAKLESEQNLLQHAESINLTISLLEKSFK